MTEEQAMALMEHMPIFFVVYLVVALFLFVFVMPVTHAATIRALANEYLDRPATPGDSMRYALKVFFPLIWTSILSTILIVLGLIACVIPGIYLVFRFGLCSEIVVIENTSGRDALKRSGALMKGNMATLFILALLLGAIGAAVGTVSAFVPVRLLGVLITVAAQVCMYVFGAAATVVFYFSCRSKLENFDLALLAEAVGKEDLAPGTPEAAAGAGSHSDSRPDSPRDRF
jgi:hypothetical protein